jgi:Domain of unknown function (DUF4349)
MRLSRRTMVVRGTALTVSAMIAIIGIGACTGSESGGSSSAGGSAQGAQMVPAGPASAAAGGTAAGRSAVAGHVAAGSSDLELSAAKIQTAELDVAVKHGESVAAKADAAEVIAAGTGGEVDADDRTSGKYPSATLLLRVPPEDLTAVLGKLSHLGTEKARHLSTKDVTSKVADVNSRVDSARVAIARLRDLYQHAVKVADVINIESELSGRESDLESLQAQQRALSAQTSMAAVTLSLTSAAAPVVKPKVTHHHHRTGFVGGLQNGWDAFSRGAAGLATAAGAVLPFAVLLVVLALAARLLWPRLRPTRRPEPVPSPPAS